MRFLLLCAAVLGCAVQLRAQEAGVLIGLDRRTTPHRYHTLWITGNGSAPVELDELILPAKDGFWRIGSQQTCAKDEGSVVEDFAASAAAVTETEELWIVPVSSAPKLVGPLRCEVALAPPPHGATEKEASTEDLREPCNSVSTTVTFVSQQYWSEIQTNSSECGAHPDGTTIFDVRRLDSEKPVALSAIFGPKADDVFARASEKANADWGKAAGGEPCTPEKVDPSSWIIYHDQGEWKTRGWVATNRLCGYGNEFQLSFTPPETIGGTRPTRVAWRFFSRAVSDAYDGVVLPDGKSAFVLSGPHCPWNDEVGCLRQTGDSFARLYVWQSNRLGKELFRLPTQRDEQIVMLVVVQGSADVTRVTRELKAIQAHGLPAPQIGR